jgi:hypothetical protein
MRLLENLEPPTTNKPCKVGVILNGLELEDRKILEVALTEFTKWSNRALSNALNDRGINVTTETLRTHRLNVCPCRRLA